MSHLIHTVKHGKRVSLKHIDSQGDTSLTKEESKLKLSPLLDKMAELQVRLYAEGKQSLLVILQAMDAGGKDGTIKAVFRGLNPLGIQVSAFKVPSAEELAHDYLWRIHAKTPPKGIIGIFNRSHYEDVLIVRINNLVPDTVWKKRYAQINAFEQLLTDSGTKIVKFFLHISKDEQKERLQDRLESPDTQWKFSKADLPVRAQWDQYMQAYDDALSKCSTEAAPWHIVPADRKWLRNLLIAETLVDTLEAMDPRFPKPEEGLENIEIPD